MVQAQRAAGRTPNGPFGNVDLCPGDHPTYDVGYDTWFTLFDIPVHQTFAKDADGHDTIGQHFESVINDLEDDYPKLKRSTYGANMEKALEQKALLEDIFGDILPVRLKMDALYSVPTQMLIHIMSMENMMYALYDYPELFKEMMNRIAGDTLEYFDYLENNHLILPTVAGENLGQGTWCFNHTLPDEAHTRPLKTTDVWGFMDSQETVGLSPWCNEEIMSEKLRGTNIIYHRKPSPNFLGVGTTLDEDAFRQHIRKSLTLARGCKMEITQRDVYTINNDIAKARRYVQIIKQEIVNLW